MNPEERQEEVQKIGLLPTSIQLDQRQAGKGDPL